ncbi:MAG: hypothetical protein LBG10_01270 [Treponema sp.]|nr:hypothetical protein [Treponema sp.]
MSKTAWRVFLSAVMGLFFSTNGIFSAPGDTVSEEKEMSRGAIPETLLRPQRGEAPRYPLDTAIGALGRGEAPEEAYLFAREVAAALIAGNPNAPSLQAMNSVSLEAFMAVLNTISPRAYRLGSGREEPDGAVSFLVRFLGRERGMAGELYIRSSENRQVTAVPLPETAGQTEEGESAGVSGTESAETAGDSEDAGQEETAGSAATGFSPEPAVWQFEDLILEEAREREVEDEHRFDFPPYERFF